MTDQLILDYTLDETKSNCNNGVIPTWDNASWEAKVNYKK